MIEFGVTSVRQLLEGKDRTFLRKNLKDVSITLYDQIIHLPEADRLAERILLTFTDERGAYKRTYAHRFDSFDQQAIEFIQNRYLSPFALVVHDAGVSDARTACDFFGKLQGLYPDLTYYASDYDPDVFILGEGYTKVVVNRDGKVLQILWPPFVFSLTKRDALRRYPVNRLAKFLAQKIVAPSMVRRFKEGRLSCRTLRLFSPRAQVLADTDPRFRLLRYNLLAPGPIPAIADVVRAMNVLNPHYFNPGEMLQVVSQLTQRLPEGGLLITGSNQESDTVVDGGIYQRQGRYLLPLWRSGNGSPVEQIVPKVFISS